MPVERWSSAQVTAAAPDAASLKSARGLAARTAWEGTGLAGEVLWGLCRGSGKKPYQVCVDVAGPAYKCSCPSRKFPCKHALGLLLLWSDGAIADDGTGNGPAQNGTGNDGRAGDGGAAGNASAGDGGGEEVPEFVREWRKGRADRAAKAAAPKSAAPADPETARKRATQREERVAAGLTELGRWLDDQVQQGLASAERAGARPWEAMAARLVDAQAPGVAGSLRRLGEVAGIGPQWADRLLGELALLRLLIAGHERLDTLPAGVAATVRSRIGFPVTTEDVLATEPVRDRWQVLGQEDSDDGPITTRRTWLLGADRGRFALHLSFAAPGQTLAVDLLPGTFFEGDLCFYPGADPLRAVIKDRTGPTRPLLPEPIGASGLRAALEAWSGALAADPWRTGRPVLLAGVTPSDDGHLTDGDGESLPLAAGHHEPWWLLAAAGGEPATVAGEWTPAGLRPFAAWTGGRFVPAAPPGPAGSARRSPELPPGLLATALVGTGRRPFAAGTVPAGDRTIPLGARTAPPPAPDSPTPAARAKATATAASATAGATAATELLEAAAVALTYGRAGVTPANGHPAVVAAPAEIIRPVPEAAGRRLLRLLGAEGGGGVPGGSQQAQELLSQWLGAAARWGGHVPAEALPALLDAGRRNSVVRPAIARVAGQRGQWLGAQRPDWRWILDEAPGTAASGDPRIWDTGTAGERLAHLNRLRAVDPAAGLALLRSTWGTEAPEDRARFVGALGTGLSADDDEFLDAALDDRRKEVREAALDLLQRLPGAALGRRMAERAHAAVQLEKRMLGRDRLIVTPPEELTPELRRDGLAAKPARGSGIQAWLLEEVLAGAPLTGWTEAFGRAPQDVVALAGGNDWEVPLLHGWAKAAIAQGDSGWATALVGHDTPDRTGGLREAVRWDLHLLLPPAELARIAADFLRREDHLAHRLLAVHPGPWPAELAIAVIETVAQRARADRHSWQLAELCRAAAPAMPPGYAPHLTKLADELGRDGADPARVRAVTELARTLTFRHEMLQEFE